MKISETPKEQPAEILKDPPAPPVPEIAQEDFSTPQQSDNNLIKISESAVYRKYFKMLKYGILPPAVKQKMNGEGLDGDLLDNPDLMIEKTPEDEEEQ